MLFSQFEHVFLMDLSRSSKPSFVLEKIKKLKASISLKPMLLLLNEQQFIQCLSWKFQQSKIITRRQYCCILSCYFGRRKKCICGIAFRFLMERKVLKLKKTLYCSCQVPCTFWKYGVANWKPVECLSPTQIHFYLLEIRSMHFLC